MKKAITSFVVVLLAAGLPAQTLLSSETFDGVNAPALPAGWSTTTVSSSGWRTDSSNFSASYTGASGMKNIFIRNSDPSGTYTLTSPSFSTVGYADIVVDWGTRVSNNFLNSGSTTPMFSFSTDGGITWTPVNYTENSANSNWEVDNAGTPIELPAAANNQAQLKFSWQITIVNNSSGTYRIDDFTLAGTNSTGINETIRATDAMSMSVYPNPSGGAFTITMPDASPSQPYFISVYNATGEQLKNVSCDHFPYTFEDAQLAAGLYFVTVSDEKGKIKAKQTLLVQ